MTANFSERLHAVLADPLAHARASSDAIGYVGADLPPDLGLAAERSFSHLPWRAGASTPWADQWLESAFPGWARSILEDWFAGCFDFFDSVIFSRGDDASQRLYYYVCELQRRGRLGGPRALIFDVAKVPRDSSVRHCRQALARLLQELDVTPDELTRGIEAANLRRRWYQGLLSNAALPGHLLENLARAVLFEDLYPSLGELEPPALADPGWPLLLGGSAPPDDRLYHAAEALGWNVRAELHPRSLARYGPGIDDAGGDPLMALARHVNRDSYGARAFSNRSAQLERLLVQHKPSAVVLWLSEEDESPAWDVARQRALLDKLRLPSLLLTRRRWEGGDGAEDELQHFLKETQA